MAGMPSGSGITSEPVFDDSPRMLLGGRPIVESRRFQFVGALLIAALVPYFFQLLLPPFGLSTSANVALAANAAAVIIAFWMRLSFDVYPGVRRSYVIMPSVLAAHGIVFAALLATRLPYTRTSLVLGVVMHVLWLYLLYLLVERRVRRRIGIVPGGASQTLVEIPGVDWRLLKRPRLHNVRSCHAIVADFSADLADEWEAFLAEAALNGRIVYQHRQLSESLTGRVKLLHLSENTFGALLPSRGYFHVKGFADFILAVAVLPIVLPVMAAIGLALLINGSSSPVFRQERIGHKGRPFTAYKFRTMKSHEIDDSRQAATTSDDDGRITSFGRFLRRYRLDELPQIFNILKWEMSWIGPRPEAAALSKWYKMEIPFYAYRHVVKPGISGWAQVNQGHVASIDDVHLKLEFDFFYVKYFSPWLDLLILFRTGKTMITGYGSR